MSIAKIRRAFRAAYREVLPDIPTEFPNREFTPPARGVWASLFVIPARRTVKSLGDGGDDLQTGFTQVDIKVPTHEGINALDDYQDLLVNSFWAGRRLQFDGQVIKIRYTETAPDRPAEGSSHVVRSITIYWESNSQRTGA